MPYFLASATKANLRQATSERLADWWSLTTSSAGNAGGTTAVFASLIGIPTSSIDNLYLLLTGATNTGEWRPITGFDPSNGIITVARAFTAQTAITETAELHAISPALYTLAGNEATAKSWDAVFRPIDGHFITNPSPAQLGRIGHYSIGKPRNMREVTRIVRVGHAHVADLFKRADSATAPGLSWTASTGTWGTTSELFYSVTDADGDFVTWDAKLKDGYLRIVARGDTTTANNRWLAGAFRIRKDYLGALDLTTCLRVRALNGAVDLVKRDAGSDTTLATSTQTVADSTDYMIEVTFEGSRIRVWLDGVEVISYELLGTDLKYLDYEGLGTRLEKTGSPGAAARASAFYAYSGNPVEIAEWRQNGDRIEIDQPAANTLLQIEGMALLTAGAADSTFETIASPTTAVYEIQTSDPGWNVLVDTAAALLRARISPDIAQRINAPELAVAMGLAEQSRSRYRMPRTRSGFKHP